MLFKNLHKEISHCSQNYFHKFSLINSYSYSSRKQIKVAKGKAKSHKIVIIGGSAIDMTIHPVSDEGLVFGRTNEGKIKSTYGGVGRNIAEVLGRLGVETAFITTIGKDVEGENILSFLQSAGVNTYPIYSTEQNTGRYIHAMNTGKDILFGLSDMKVNNNLTFQNIYQNYFANYELQPNTIVQLDSCIPAKEMKKLIPYLNQKKVRIFLEGIGNITLRLFESGCLNLINQFKFNNQEIQIMAENIRNNHIKDRTDTEGVKKYISSQIGKESLYRDLKGEQHKSVIFTKGAGGIQAYFNGIKHDLDVVKVNKIQKTNGAGDTSTGVILSCFLKGLPYRQSLIYGMCGSKITIQSPSGKSTIPEHISTSLLNSIRKNHEQQ